MPGSTPIFASFYQNITAERNKMHPIKNIHIKTAVANLSDSEVRRSWTVLV